MKVKKVEPKKDCRYCKGTGYDFLYELCEYLPLTGDERKQAKDKLLFVQVDNEYQDYTGQQSIGNQ